MTSVKTFMQTATPSTSTVDANPVATVQQPKPVLVTPRLPPANVAQVVQGPTPDVAPKTIAGSVLTAMKGGFDGIDARIKQIQGIMMRAMMTAEASQRLQSEIDVLTAMKGGGAAVNKAYDAQVKLMMVSRFTPEGAKAANEKLEALKAAKDAFAVVHAAANDLTKAMQVSRYTKDAYQVALATLSALRSFEGGANAIAAREKAIDATPATNADEKAAFALEKQALAAVKGGVDGVKAALMGVLKEISVSTWESPEQTQRKNLFTALEATFAKIPTSASVAPVTPVEPVEPERTIKTAVLEALRGGYQGVAKGIKDLENLKMRARFSQEGLALVNAQIDVLKAIQGGAAGVDKALEAQIKVVSTWGSSEPISPSQTEKLEALQAAKQAFAVFANEAKSLEGLMMRALLSPDASRIMEAQVAAYKAFVEGPSALESGVSQQWLEIARTPAMQHVSEMLGLACSTLLGGAKAIAEAKDALMKQQMVSMMTPEQAQRMKEKIDLLDALAATFAKV